MNKKETMNSKKTGKKSPKKLILWEGFRKELPWILFWALLMVMAYGYYQDKKICDEVLANPCDTCYKLNQTLMSSDYLFDNREIAFSNDINMIINKSLIQIPLEDKNPNDRTISSFK